MTEWDCIACGRTRSERPEVERQHGCCGVYSRVCADCYVGRFTTYLELDNLHKFGGYCRRGKDGG